MTLLEYLSTHQMACPHKCPQGQTSTKADSAGHD